MDAFTTLTGIAAPLDRANADTDQIIPKQFLKRIERTGFGKFLFFDNPEFLLNQPQYQGAAVLIAGKNFGCGSSREHAPWALNDYGFRVIIAPSYADIFYNNCFKNGMLPLVLPEDTVALLMERALSPGYTLTVDLETQTVSDSTGWQETFEVDAFRRHCLLNGLDDIGLTLEHEPDITAYESARPAWKRGAGVASAAH